MENHGLIVWILIVCIIKMSIQQDTTADTDQSCCRTSNVKSRMDFFFNQQGEFPKDCQEVKDGCTENENRVSGVYLIKPEGCEEPFEVFCDHETEDGGWTVVQRRQDHSTDFARPWQYYKKGFGFLNQEFWLGNDKLAYLTNQKQYVLRIEFEPSREQWVHYNHFQISDEKGSYKLVKVGEFSSEGTFRNRMSLQVGMPFSTQDRISNSDSTCARSHGAGGWWFAKECYKPNLNGLYGGKGIIRFHWQAETLQFSEMKIKPAEFV